ncbi:chondroitin AC lyase [Pedobacter sp. BS3]|uniref:polysaccharide lyase family 8 super-sandwich domain-containing protein n=1 Tax=Pedobacter sp. BS3 TaxID=2567937 RepID=UPI0011F0602F|nr:polysaccharide lyase family 8 super-sandwich domain-containing protein [Pedobacter sp. BS3]TZF83229.1 chondroitin AC lyase [Pedobacter sp. BS3]
MKYRIIFIIIFHSFFLFRAQAQTDTLLNRYREYLFRTSPLQTESVKTWIATLNPAGQWPDIDYKDKEPAGWKPSQHLLRIREIALVWANPQSPDYHNGHLLNKITIALDHWLAKRYQSSNWWHNEIGIPRLMRDILILVRGNLDAERMKQALEVMAQLRVHDDYLGGNLVWCADLGLHYGALTGDEKLINHCRELIIREIKITTGEGIQPDYSFHQHGKRLQMYQYGKAYLWESLRVAWQLRETPLAFPAEKVTILTDMVLKGWQWMARGIYTVPGTMDRSASRKGELKSADLRPLLPFIIALQPAKANELKTMEAIQNGKGALNGFRYYPYSDFAAFHRPGFSFFLKTISDRTLVTESINHENLKGKLLNSGDAYLIRNGKEYTDLLPVWDWTALPGVTTFKDAYQVNRLPFVGSVSDKTDGCSAMDYQLKDKTGKQVLSARKFWACYQDAVVCLIADIKAGNIPGNIYTALDQCRWQGDVTVNKVGNVLDTGVHQLEHVTWIQHAGFAYIPLQPASFELRLQEVSGSWTTINASETTEPVAGKMFTPVMLHHPEQNSAAGYVLARCETPRQAKKLAGKPSWKILQNDKNCQAVQFKDGAMMAVFYTPAKLQTGKQQSIQADQPCLVLLKNGKLYASDPSHKGLQANFILNNKTVSMTLPADGTTVAETIK